MLQTLRNIQYTALPRKTFTKLETACSSKPLPHDDLTIRRNNLEDYHLNCDKH